MHYMHGPNGLNGVRSASPRAPAQVDAVGHGSILREASSIVTQAKRRKNISDMTETRKTRRGLISGPSRGYRDLARLVSES